MKQIAILGAGGHAVSIAETAASAGFVVRCFIEDNPRAVSLLGVPIVRSVPAGFVSDGGVFAVAIGDNSVRQRVATQWQKQVDGASFPSLVHATASVSRYASLAEGSVVLQGAIVGSKARVGRFCIMNTGASIDHDCVLNDFSSLAPRAVTGGDVTVGTRSAVGIGAVVKHGVTIGNDVVVGANSYVNQDVPNLVVAYGSPAKVVRSRRSSDPYLSGSAPFHDC